MFGKSFCDICLSDPESVSSALQLFKNDKSNEQFSHLEALFEGDNYRKKSMIEANVYPQALILNLDLNLSSTIQKAIMLKAVKSLKLLIDMVFENYNTIEYQEFIMYDLDLLLTEKHNVHFFAFFGRSENEKRNSEDFGYCNMETPFKNVNLPTFSNLHLETLLISEFENQHNFEPQMLQLIIERDKKVPDF